MPSLETLLAAAAVVLLLAVIFLAIAWRLSARHAAMDTARLNDVSTIIETRLAEVARIQSEMKGGVQAMAEAFGSRQSEIANGLSERMEGLGARIGLTMGETTKNTFESLAKLQERLAVIDSAQRTITDLSTQVVELQHILADKHQRGIFGQARMEAIVQDGLPIGAYSFQETLSNGKRPDCVVKLPNGAPRLVIDAKFPLEAWNAMHAANLAGEAVNSARTLFRRDINFHVRAIRDRYFIAGETQDTAFMFVPSESIFADLHEHFPDVVQEAYRSRVVIVSPSLLMLSIQVMQAVMKDARMREQADIIRAQVVTLVRDVGRLDKRVRELQTHFGQAARDVDQILISTGKIVTRGERITSVDLSEESPELPLPAPPAAVAPMPPPPPPAEVAVAAAALATAEPAVDAVPMRNGKDAVPGMAAAEAAARSIDELFAGIATIGDGTDTGSKKAGGPKPVGSAATLPPVIFAGPPPETAAVNPPKPGNGAAHPNNGGGLPGLAPRVTEAIDLPATSEPARPVGATERATG